MFMARGSWDLANADIGMFIPKPHCISSFLCSSSLLSRSFALGTGALTVLSAVIEVAAIACKKNCQSGSRSKVFYNK